jgi:hypothetical protein
MELMQNSFQKPSQKTIKHQYKNGTLKASKKSLKSSPTLRFRGPILGHIPTEVNAIAFRYAVLFF